MGKLYWQTQSSLNCDMSLSFKDYPKRRWMHLLYKLYHMDAQIRQMWYVCSAQLGMELCWCSCVHSHYPNIHMCRHPERMPLDYWDASCFIWGEGTLETGELEARWMYEWLPGRWVYLRQGTVVSAACSWREDNPHLTSIPSPVGRRERLWGSDRSRGPSHMGPAQIMSCIHESLFVNNHLAVDSL